MALWTGWTTGQKKLKERVFLVDFSKKKGHVFL